MEVLSLIKSSLGSEDSNPIHRLYRVGQQVGVCGQENVWRIHEAESIEEEKVSGSIKSNSSLTRVSSVYCQKTNQIVLIVACTSSRPS